MVEIRRVRGLRRGGLQIAYALRHVIPGVFQFFCAEPRKCIEYLTSHPEQLSLTRSPVRDRHLTEISPTILKYRQHQTSKSTMSNMQAVKPLSQIVSWVLCQPIILLHRADLSTSQGMPSMQIDMQPVESSQ